MITPTPDEINDMIRKRVESELPRPLGGFESADAEDEWRERSDKRFLELCAAHITAP